MKKLRLADVAIGDMKKSDGWEARVDAPLVAELAKSIAKYGLLQYPMVRESDLQLIFGEDRVAACFVNGDDVVRCVLVECEDEEVDIIRATENVKRRQYDSASWRFERQRLVHYEKVRADLRARNTTISDVENRRQTIAAIASQANIALGAARKALAKEAPPIALKVPKKPRPKPIPELENVSRLWQDDYRATQQHYKALRVLLTRITTRFKKLETLNVDKAKLYMATEAVDALSGTIDDMEPFAYCPTCNVERRQQCQTCSGTGYVSKALSEILKGKLPQ